jgi:hypothetical protein
MLSRVAMLKQSKDAAGGCDSLKILNFELIFLNRALLVQNKILLLPHVRFETAFEARK